MSQVNDKNNKNKVGAMSNYNQNNKSKVIKHDITCNIIQNTII